MAEGEEVGLTRLYGHVITGTAGAITSQECNGFTVEKTAATNGRYTVNLSKKYLALRHCNVVIKCSDSAALTAGLGTTNFLRQVDVNKDMPKLYIQFVNSKNPQEDANLENNAHIYIELILKKGNFPDTSLEIPNSQDMSDILIDQLPDDTEANRQIKESMYRLSEKLKEIFNYYENNIGDLQ